MKRYEFEKYLQNAIEVAKSYKDKEGQEPKVIVSRLFRRKCIEVTFWHGCGNKTRSALCSGRIKFAELCGYPVIFDNHKGGGAVESFTIMWTDNIY